MLTNSRIRFLVSLAAMLLVLPTARYVYSSAERVMSKPQPISGPMKSGYDFTVVAMNGTEPAELIHEWSTTIADRMRGRKAVSKQQRAALRAELAETCGPIVWADTGKAAGSYRYYLTDADLARANSDLDSKSAESPHDVQVKVLEDNPQQQYQLLKVSIIGEDTDYHNVYQVRDGRVRPVAWSRFRSRFMGFPFLFVLVISFFAWRRALYAGLSLYTTLRRRLRPAS